MAVIRPPECELWLIENRCHACVHRAQCPGNYKVARTYDGWRCYGFRSRFLDERTWEGKVETCGRDAR